MLDLQIAELSTTAGISSDGIVRGAVAQSLVAKAVTSTQTSDVVYAYRKDSGAGFNFIDVSTQAVSGTPDAFEPWGPTSTFTSGDALYISCNQDIKELYFQITTPGVWTGTGLSVFDSSDGITAGMAEILVFPVVLSATERAKAEGYLAWKYGLQANLPVGHTYIGAAPTVLDIPVYANNAAAIAGGLTLGMLYRTGADPDLLAVVH